MHNSIKFSEGLYLAIHGMIFIAHNIPERVSIKQLSKHINASENHLVKVFHNLNKAGLLKSVRGPIGGFELNKSPEDISLMEIFEIVEGKVNQSDCPFGKTVCAFEDCVFQDEFRKISNEFYNLLISKKLSDYLNQ